MDTVFVASVGTVLKGTTIIDLGVGPEEIEKKKFGGPSPGKYKF